MVVNYGLNAIPTANLSFAVGVEVNGGVAEIQKGLAQQQNNGYMQPAQLYMTLGTKEQKVFDGYLTGLGYQRMHGGVSVTASLAGKAIDLAFSTAVVDSLQSLNSKQFDSEAVMSSKEGSDRRMFFPFDSLTKISETAQTDIGAAIIEGMKLVVEKEILRPGSAAECYGSVGSNKPALAILNNIVTKGGTGGGSGGYGHTFSGAVKANFGQIGGFDISDGIGLFFASQMADAHILSGLWDKLVGALAPELKLAVIPLVEKILLVPFTPCLSKFGGTIKSEDIASVSITSQVARPLRGVNVLGTFFDTDGYNGTADAAGAGCYGPSDQNAGAVMFVTAPAWISKIPALDTQQKSTPVTTGVQQGATVPIRTAFCSDVTRGSAQQEIVSTREEKKEGVKNLYERYAQALYYQERLRGRRGTISTNLRWDIAPGSTIKIETNSPYQPFGNKFEGQPFVASVDRISIWMDAEGAQAGTSFQLSYCRTEKENEEMGLDKHPLYDSAPFTGACLIGGKS